MFPLNALAAADGLQRLSCGTIPMMQNIGVLDIYSVLDDIQ